MDKHSMTHNQSAMVPPTFGHTHFILGMPVQEAHHLHQQTQHQSTSCQGCVKHAFFSPDDALEKRLIEFIDQERESLKIAVFQFTNIEIARALKRARARGINIEIITDPLCLQDKFNKITWLSQDGVAVYIYNPDQSKATLSNKMHHKFVVFGKNINNKKLVWVGSFNFTKSASVANQESVVVLDDEQIITKFEQQYGLLKKRSNAFRVFAKNHIIVQSYQPKEPHTKFRMKTTVAKTHNNRSYAI
jgi:phosphatidylserine/phosphatidylglycerophosphate/cardiolipin synthase-like enzyme